MQRRLKEKVLVSQTFDLFPVLSGTGLPSGTLQVAPADIIRTSMHHPHQHASLVPVYIIRTSIHHSSQHASFATACIIRTSIHPSHESGVCRCSLVPEDRSAWVIPFWSRGQRRQHTAIHLEDAAQKRRGLGSGWVRAWSRCRCRGGGRPHQRGRLLNAGGGQLGALVRLEVDGLGRRDAAVVAAAHRPQLPPLHLCSGAHASMSPCPACEAQSQSVHP